MNTVINRRRLLAAAPLAAVPLALAATPAMAQAAGILVLGAGDHVPDASWDDREVWFTDAARVMLPPANFLPSGFRCRFRKADPNSGLVEIRPTDPLDRLNHFWTAAAPYGLFLNLTQQMADLSCDGANDYALAGLSLHHNVPQSQRTITVPSWNMTPASVNCILQCNTQSAGQAIFIAIAPITQFCPTSPVQGGNYHSFVFWAQKVDAGAGVIAFARGDGGRIEPSNDPLITGLNRGYYYLKRQWDCAQFYITAGGIFVISQFQAADMPR